MSLISRYSSFSRMTGPLEVSKPFYPSEDDGLDITKLTHEKLIKHFKEHPPKTSLFCENFRRTTGNDRIFVQLEGSKRLVKLTESAEFCIETGRLAFKVDDHAREILYNSRTGDDYYEKDLFTGKPILNTSLGAVIIRHLFHATQVYTALDAIACTVNMFYLAAKVSYNVANGIYQETKAAFTENKKTLEEGFWQSQARDITRIVQTPFLLIGLMLTPFYGLINPYGGRRLYNDLNECLYGDFNDHIRKIALKNCDPSLAETHEREDEGLTFSSLLEKKIPTLALQNPESSFSLKFGKPFEIKVSVVNGVVEGILELEDLVSCLGHPPVPPAKLILSSPLNG